jgi:hypothetical protein
MSNVINFPSDLKFKVLFELPEDKILRMDKTKAENCKIEIDGQYGTAIVHSINNQRAVKTLLDVFPSAIIIETTKYNEF